MLAKVSEILQEYMKNIQNWTKTEIYWKFITSLVCFDISGIFKIQKLDFGGAEGRVELSYEEIIGSNLYVSADTRWHDSN